MIVGFATARVWGGFAMGFRELRHLKDKRLELVLFLRDPREKVSQHLIHGLAFFDDHHLSADGARSRGLEPRANAIFVEPVFAR